MPGEFAARRLKKIRQKFRWSSSKYVESMKRKIGKASDPLEGAPQALGIVVEKVTREQKQPSSGLTKGCRVQLIKNSITVTAFSPGDRSWGYIEEHDEVLIEGLGGAQGGPIGTMWGIKYKIIKVNGISLEELRMGRKEKPKR